VICVQYTAHSPASTSTSTAWALVTGWHSSRQVLCLTAFLCTNQTQQLVTCVNTARLLSHRTPVRPAFLSQPKHALAARLQVSAAALRQGVSRSSSTAFPSLTDTRHSHDTRVDCVKQHLHLTARATCSLAVSSAILEYSALHGRPAACIPVPGWTFYAYLARAVARRGTRNLAPLCPVLLVVNSRQQRMTRTMARQAVVVQVMQVTPPIRRSVQGKAAAPATTAAT
jgi:hypothetical protein